MKIRAIAATAAAILASTPPAAHAAAPGDAPTPDAIAQPDTSTDILVTARRRPEDPQTIPGSLSVVSGALLDRSYTINTQGLSVLVPALNYSSANPRNTAFTIRGLGSSVVAVSQANDGLEPGVGYYVDQVYHARPATAAFDFSDIDHVEVLRGPQGTLFGKNSTAGAISITTREPTFEPEAEEEVSIGSRNFVQAKAAASGALIGDTVAGRISAVVTRRDGVIHDLRTGADLNTIGNQAVRGQLLIKPNDTFRLRLTADFSTFESDCCTQVYLRVAPTLKAAARQYAALAANVPGGAYTPASRNPYDRLTDIDAAVGTNTNEGGVSAVADWNLGPATLTSVSAWRFWNWDAANDRDYTGIPIQTSQHIPSRQDQYSQELRIASNGDHALSYVGGLYFFRQRVIGRPISIYGPLATYWLLGSPSAALPGNLLDGYGSDGRTDFQSNSYAAFGEVNWRPLAGLTLTGGLRYTYETKTGSYNTFTFGGPTGLTQAQINSQLSVLRGQVYDAKVNDGSLTGRANVAYDFTPGVLGYVSFARGAKSGGINMSGLPLDNTNQPALSKAVVRPETNTAYEIGLKTRLFDRRLTFNIDGYYTRVTDFQANVTDTGAAAALRTYLANIPKVTVKGFEADAVATPIPALSLRGAVAYAAGDYTSYPNAPCPIEAISSSTTVCNLSGKPLSSLPKWTVSAGGDYTLPVPALRGAVILHADSMSRTSQYGDPTDSAYTRINGYTLVNASLGYRNNAGWEIDVFARNLFDANYLQNVTIQAGNSGLILATPSDPRTIGVTFRARQ
ncbi:TonB-dependent receptor [Sphingomonas sp. H39-1-10]|uniref:TonB-dependent receptor n=1 Tax=Sphingomonas TaxID=13687 RepID=UPI00087F8E4C|nr:MULTISPECIES: TonB-dependent receptor [Sphingomonas]MDF0487643.1 TonB-dependent receptor [Sphingomonas pollutisoli]SDA17158.1 iron complex outermembrane recepter protein [Sphingomonas sp. NFR15]